MSLLSRLVALGSIALSLACAGAGPVAAPVVDPLPWAELEGRWRAVDDDGPGLHFSSFCGAWYGVELKGNVLEYDEGYSDLPLTVTLLEGTRTTDGWTFKVHVDRLPGGMEEGPKVIEVHRKKDLVEWDVGPMLTARSDKHLPEMVECCAVDGFSGETLGTGVMVPEGKPCPEQAQ